MADHRGSACLCPTCLVLGRVSILANSQLQSPAFRSTVLSRLRSLEGELRDLAELDLRARPDQGAPPPRSAGVTPVGGSVPLISPVPEGEAKD